MLQRLLPPRIDNSFRGQRLALWIFGVFVLMKGGAQLGRPAGVDPIPRSNVAPDPAQVWLDPDS